MKKLFYKFDDYFINIFNKRIKNDCFDKIMYYITNIGGAISSTIISITLILFGDEGIRFFGFELLVAIVFSQFFVQIFKRTLGRQRPYKVLDDINTFGIDMKDYSFPSGHTTASFCMATIISINYPQLLTFAILFAFLIGISRIYLGVHFPSDVLAGAMLGVVSAFIVHYYFQWPVQLLHNIFTIIKL